MHCERIGPHRLYHGDCRELLPSLAGAVQGVVTDPPYGVNLKVDSRRFSGGSSARRKKRGTGKNYGRPIHEDDQEFDPSPFLLGTDQIIWGWNNFPDKAAPRGLGVD